MVDVQVFDSGLNNMFTTQLPSHVADKFRDCCRVWEGIMYVEWKHFQFVMNSYA